ncbi:MAG: response regulator transcription factor [Elusimicrobia bacterium]|nr:response regulator transcription factor [Elusimicrobiota bacterium]
MAQTERPRIVSVEDDADVQDVLRGWLTPHFDFILMKDGEELLEDIEELDPDLVMLDIGLPGPDGLRLCQRLRHTPGLAEVPILIFTGRDDDEAFVSSLDAGASSFLLKPVDKETLLDKIEELIGPL